MALRDETALKMEIFCTEHISYFLWLDVNTVEHRLLMLDLECMAGGRFCVGWMKNAQISVNYLLLILICSVYIMLQLYVLVFRLAASSVI